ncbi:hypothetical protein ACQPTN_06265 [Bradyrhizobium sp. 13971]
MQVQVRAEQRTDRRRTTKPSSGCSGSKRQIGAFGSASLSRAFKFFGSDGQESRCGLVQQLIILFLHD